MQTQVESQMNQIMQGLGLEPEQIDTAHLLPIFVPASFFAAGDWSGPYTRLRTADLGLTWTVLLPDQTMRYVDDDMMQYWELCRIDWKAIALRNLVDLTQDRPGMQPMRRPTGELSALALTFDDGLGPSRLLFREKLAKEFPNGYRVALPEMGCGFAFAKDLKGEELENIESVISKCYRTGVSPLVPGIYDADDLLPVDPID
jgi:hypothetical protein